MDHELNFSAAEISRKGWDDLCVVPRAVSLLRFDPKNMDQTDQIDQIFLQVAENKLIENLYGSGWIKISDINS